jgi:hypothetical protein
MEGTETMNVIKIPKTKLFDALGPNGEHWIKGNWQRGDGMCFHQAIKVCVPQPGDFFIVEKIAQRQGWGTAWNDATKTNWTDIANKINGGIGITDADCLETFGPGWRSVIKIVRRAAILTPSEIQQLKLNYAAADAAYAAADAAYAAAAADAAYAAAAADAAYAAAADAADAAYAAYAAAAARWSTGYAARAAATKHLIGTHGYTRKHYNALMVPWKAAIK